MPCYVDPARHPYGHMLMCHLWADTREELLAMAARIGVGRRWIQEPPMASWLHFDICQAKRRAAIAAGALVTDELGPLEHRARLEGNRTNLDRIAETRARRAERRAS